MAWLIFAVVSKDYKGKGLFILIFIFGTMLGVVDELEQGINPARFYGLSDMIVNSASVMIGVFTIMGLKKVIATDWAWTTHLKRYKGTLRVEPVWIDRCSHYVCVPFSRPGNGVFLECLSCLAVELECSFPDHDPRDDIVLIEVFFKLPFKLPMLGMSSVQSAEGITARLWILPLLVILFYMHALVIYLSITGVPFV